MAPAAPRCRKAIAVPVCETLVKSDVMAEKRHAATRRNVGEQRRAQAAWMEVERRPMRMACARDRPSISHSLHAVCSTVSNILYGCTYTSARGLCAGPVRANWMGSLARQVRALRIGDGRPASIRARGCRMRWTGCAGLEQAAFPQAPVIAAQ